MLLLIFKYMATLLGIGLSPLVLFAKREKVIFYYLAWLFFYYLAHNLINFGASLLSQHIGFGTLLNNWRPILYIIWALIFIQLCPFLTANNCNLRIRQEPGSMRFSLLFLVILPLLSFLYDLVDKTSSPLTWYHLVHGALLPGITEEIMFRGITLTILVAVCVREFRFMRVRLVNPAILVVGVLFAMIHVVWVSTQHGISLEWRYFIPPFIVGTSLAWLTLRSRSILFPILIHSTVDFVDMLAYYFK